MRTRFITLSGDLARQSAVLRQSKDWVAGRCIWEIKGGPFAGIDRALATRSRLLADTETVKRAHLTTNADILGDLVAMIFFTF